MSLVSPSSARQKLPAIDEYSVLCLSAWAMPNSTILRFVDPHEYQRSVRAADMKVFVTAPGEYRAELTRIDLHRLWMQRSRVSLPHITHSAVNKARSVTFFLTHARQTPMHHSGVELLPGDMMFDSPGAEHYHRSSAECQWGAMSLTPEDLAAAGRALVGNDLTAPAVTRRIRPPPHLMSRLLRLHEAADHLASGAPNILAHPEVARALEHELVCAMTACLTSGTAGESISRGHQRVPVMRRFERVLEANQGRTLYLAEICTEIGVAARTLRAHCQEQLGMSPHRYLWLRRMNLARRALTLADATATTVTAIAMDHGFGELGRFAVTYRSLFGETPSTTLRRPPDHRLITQGRHFGSELPILP
jgi:AraC-like DNA-binding protein